MSVPVQVILHVMRLLSWNVNHRADVSAIPASVVPAVAAQEPDVLVCTGYVRGPQHVEVLGALRAIGLRDSDVTVPHREGASCILVAAREPLMGGPVQPPAESAPSVQAGFAHVILERSAVHLFVVKVPEVGEKIGADGKPLVWLGEALEPYRDEPAIVIADVDGTSGAELNALEQRGWRLASPETPLREDHQRQHVAFVSPVLTVSNAEYSSRAMLLIDVS